MWSEGSTSISASVSTQARVRAARQTAGPVLRISGSITIRVASTPTSDICSATMKRKSLAVSSSGGA